MAGILKAFSLPFKLPPSSSPTSSLLLSHPFLSLSPPHPAPLSLGGFVLTEAVCAPALAAVGRGAVQTDTEQE